MRVLAQYARRRPLAGLQAFAGFFRTPKAGGAMAAAPGLGPEQEQEQEQPPGWGSVTIRTMDLHEHARALLASRATAEPNVAGPCVALCGVVNPLNIGSTYRLMACLGFLTLRRIAGESEHSAAVTLGHAPSKQKLRSTSKSCERHVHTHPPMALPDFLAELQRCDGGGGGGGGCGSAEGGGSDSDNGGVGVGGGEGQPPRAAPLLLPARPPIVAIETASGAVDIHGFRWPRECTIMVGGESDGIPASVVQRLRPGYDHLVIIPMCGLHKSLNVATALAMALFSYRGQHPGGGVHAAVV